MERMTTAGMTTTGGNLGCKGLRAAFWGAAIALGGLDAWTTRFTMNPDGVSYLDMGDAYLRGDWRMAVNAYWSPLYSWLLGAALKGLKPSARWEYPVAHLVNFIVYLAALGCFEYFMRAFIRHQNNRGDLQAQETSLGKEESAVLPEWAWWTLGYSLFIFTSLVLIGMRTVTPDMCVAAFVYLACGLLLRLRTGAATRRTFVLLGLVLGLGYVAKAVMFPLALVFLAVALFSAGGPRKGLPGVLTSTLAFIVIVSPLVMAISRAKHRLTFGDTGRVNYQIYVDGADIFIPRGSELKHPIRTVLDRPPVYEFAEPIDGAYPLWYDTSYWHDGLPSRFDLGGQAHAIAVCLALYAWLLFSAFLQLNLTIALLVLILLAPRPWRGVKRAAANWALLVPGLAAFGLYALVHAEYRFLAAFVGVLWLAAFGGVALPAGSESRRLIAGVVIAVAATTGALVIRSNVHYRALAAKTGDAYPDVAVALNQDGLGPGDKIAVIAEEPWGEGGAFAARLARVRITSEVYPPASFWTASPATRAQALDAIRQSGAKLVLTRGDPACSAGQSSWQRLAGWQRVAGTDYYAYRLTASP